MPTRTLKQWLSWITQVTKTILPDSFEQAFKAAAHLKLTNFDVPVISVTGTNGKGSCVAVLESILIEAGYKVGAYTSPHLFEFNERVRISGNNVSDALLCDAFEKVFQESSDFQLNFFSFITMAALLIFTQEECDIIILEVGIGGRLDATNVVENDVVVITTVGLDHCELLGDSIEKIAFEKAGLIKKNKAVVFGDVPVPQAVLNRARERGAVLYLPSSRAQHGDSGKIKALFRVEHEIQLYQHVTNHDDWSWQHETIKYEQLPIPQVLLSNAAAALMALTHLKLTVSVENIREGLLKVFLPARCQIILGDITIMLDVAHNEQAAELLAKKIIELKPKKVFAVFSALGRKDISALLKPLKPLVNRWFVAPMQDPESASIERLSGDLPGCELLACDSIKKAYEAAQSMAEQGDLIVVFGSFRMFNELSFMMNHS